jgi:hypothetical protein
MSFGIFCLDCEKRNKKGRERGLSYQKERYCRGSKFGIFFIKHRLRVTGGSEENIKMREKEI